MPHRIRKNLAGDSIWCNQITLFSVCVNVTVAMWIAPAFGQEFHSFATPLEGVTSSYLYGMSADGKVLVGQAFNAADAEAFRWTAAGGLVRLGDFPSWKLESSAQAVTPDGQTIVGIGHLNSGHQAFIWTAEEGMVALGNLPGGVYSTGWAVSDDGKVVVGSSIYNGAHTPYRWTAETGMALLDATTAGVAQYVSGDGKIVAGQTTTNGNNDVFYWTESGGMQKLGDLPGGGINTSMYAMSADGQVLVGRAYSGNGNEAFVWTSGAGMVGLGDLPGGGFSSMATGVTSNGSAIFGQGFSANGAEAFRWTASEGMIGLGDISGGAFNSLPQDASADGAVIVGRGYTANGADAFLWDEVYGMQSLRDILAQQYSIDLTGWNLFRTTYSPTGVLISDDGRTIAGSGTNPLGEQAIWQVSGLHVNRRLDATDTYTLSAGETQAIGMLGGSGTVNLGAGSSLSVGGNNLSTNAAVNPNTLFTGVIAGAGDLEKSGTGLWRLTGTFASSGDVKIHGGTLQLGNAERLADTADLTVDAGATFDMANYNETVASLGGAGTVSMGSGNLTLSGATNAAFGGTLTGTGALVKSGTGTWQLNGTYASTGNLLLQGGALQLGGNDRLSDTATVNLGSGATLDLAGYSDTFGRLSGSGAVALGGGTLTLNEAGSASYVGLIGGTGNLTKMGAGLWRLDGTFASSGDVRVQAGTLQLGGAERLADTADVTVDTGGVLDLNGRNETIASLSGGGQVALGGAAFAVSGAANTTYAGAIGGTGSFIKTGAGTLNLTGTNTYSGPTTVQGGLLKVNGSLNGPVSVSSGGKLGGAGQVGTLTVNSGGTLGPGNSPGTLTVTGDVTFGGGSTYEVETTAAGVSDRVNASGHASIASTALVKVLAENGVYTPKTTYTILNAGNGVTGTFGGLTSNLAFLTPSLTYGENQVMLTLRRNDIQVSDAGSTPNQQSVGQVFDQTPNPTNPDFQQVKDILVGQSYSGAQGILSGLTGELLSAFKPVQVTLQSGVSQQIALRMRSLRVAADVPSAQLAYTGENVLALNPLEDLVADPYQNGAIWGRGYALRSNVDETNGVAGYSHKAYGMLAGTDRVLDGGVVLGVYGGYITGDTQAGESSDSIDSMTWQAGVYGGWSSGPWAINANLGYAWTEADSVRHIEVGGISRTAKGSPEAHAIGAELTVGRNIPLGQGFELFPQAGLNWDWVRQNEYIESGADALNLIVEDQTSQGVTTELGASLRKTITFDNGDSIIPEVRAFWRQRIGDRGAVMDASLAGAPEAGTFRITGVQPGRAALAMGAGIDLLSASSPGLRLTFDYDAQLRKHADEHVATIGLKYKW